MAANRKIMALLKCTLDDVDRYGSWCSEDFQFNTSFVAADKARKWHRTAAELDRRKRLQRRYLKEFKADTPNTLWGGVLTSD